MKILLTGATGYVGGLILRNFRKTWEINCISSQPQNAPSYITCDLTNKESVRQLSKITDPDVIIHAAGNKNINFCQENPLAAHLTNIETTKNLAINFPEKKIIYISSDYVFPGEHGKYNEASQPHPLTTYGATKASAETTGVTLSKNFIVLRLSALYDQDAPFIRFLQDNLKKNESTPCYADAYYSPTCFMNFLLTLQRIVECPLTKNGIFHACGPRISRYEFAQLFAKTNNYDTKLISKSSRITDNAKFIFSDISMENKETRKIFKLPDFHHEQSLLKIFRGQSPH